MPEIEIRINSIGKVSILMKVDSSCTVQEFKQKIAEKPEMIKIKMSTDGMRLVYKGKPLNDDITLQGCGCVSGSVMYLTRGVTDKSPVIDTDKSVKYPPMDLYTRVKGEEIEAFMKKMTAGKSSKEMVQSMGFKNDLEMLTSHRDKYLWNDEVDEEHSYVLAAFSPEERQIIERFVLSEPFPLYKRTGGNVDLFQRKLVVMQICGAVDYGLPREHPFRNALPKWFLDTLPDWIHDTSLEQTERDRMLSVRNYVVSDDVEAQQFISDSFSPAEREKLRAIFAIRYKHMLYSGGGNVDLRVKKLVETFLCEALHSGLPDNNPIRKFLPKRFLDRLPDYDPDK